MIKKKRIWVSEPFHRWIKKQATEEGKSILKWSDDKMKDPIEEMRIRQKKQKKRFNDDFFRI